MSGYLTKEAEILQKKTFYGKEKKSLAYIIGIMNMILHGIEAPNILHTNTLAENLADIQDKDRFDVILAILPSAVKNARKCSGISPFVPARRPSFFSNISLKS